MSAPPPSREALTAGAVGVDRQVGMGPHAV